MSNNKYCIIMAGGIGSRFWPMSRQSMPKQFLDIMGIGRSFIRQAYDRFAPIVPAENFLVVTNANYKSLILEHIPELKPEQVLCEPIGRNTAPCIAYAAYSLLKINPDAEMIITPSDQYIADEENFRSIIEECVDFAAHHDALMTVGIKPTRPETGYGYIQVSDQNKISRVKCFTEKPNAELAQTFISCGEFLWNSGIFVWKVSSIIEAIERYLPSIHQLFYSIMDSYGTPDEATAIDHVYSECKSISIDYGVMERTDNVYVRSGEFGWSDVGTWGSVYQLSERDERENNLASNNYLYDTYNSYISVPKDKIAVVRGLSDYIVVDTDDVLMICPREEEQNIKKFIEDVKYRDGGEHI